MSRTDTDRDGAAAAVPGPATAHAARLVAEAFRPARDLPDDPWDSPWNALEQPVAPPEHGEAPAAKPTRLPLRLWSVFAGLLVWCSAFLMLYAGLSLGCEAGWQHRTVAGTTWLTALLAGIWLLHIAALGVLAAMLLRRHPDVKIAHDGEQHPSAPRPQGGFLTRLALVLTAAATACTAWIGWPALLLPPCTAF